MARISITGLGGKKDKKEWEKLTQIRTQQCVRIRGENLSLCRYIFKWMEIKGKKNNGMCSQQQTVRSSTFFLLSSANLKKNLASDV